MRNFLLGILALSGIIASAQTTTEPLLVHNAYFLGISHNGVYAGSQAGGVTIYNIDNGDAYYYDGYLGLSNCWIADNGIAVGSTPEGFAAIFKNGSAVIPSLMNKSIMSSFNGISKDGTKVTGYAANPEAGDNGMDFTAGDIVPLIPFYGELDAEGNMTYLELLPYPKKDFMGYRPQYVLGNSISDDGNTIIGFMVDSYGRLTDPVLYKRNAEGEWAYYFPTQPMYNPMHIELPYNPWDDAPPSAAIENFMTDQQWEDYQEDLWSFLTDPTWVGEGPEPMDYMTNTQIQAYIEARDLFDEWYAASIPALRAYDNAYAELLRTTPTFGFNDYIISSDGSIFACTGNTGENEEGISNGGIFVFSLTGDPTDAVTGGYEPTLLNASRGVGAPRQFMPDGSLLAAQSIDTGTSSTFILQPNSDNFISMKTYFQNTNPSYADWMSNVIPNGTGVISISDDWTRYAGGLQMFHFADYDIEGDELYTSFIFSSTPLYMGEPNYKGDVWDSGVEELMTGANEILHVYNLQGVNVANGDNSVLKTLEKGIYIVNGKKIAIR